MQVRRIPHGDVTVLALSGKIMGGPEFEAFKAEISDLIGAGRPNVILDFEDVPWINSSGLGMLITAHHSLKAASGTLKMCRVNERVLSIFQVSRLERVFEVHPDREKALASYR